MAKKPKRWWHPLRRAALIVIVPILVIPFILSMPIWLPLVGWSHARAERRKRALVECWPCGWCRAPLGEQALLRADALDAAWHAKDAEQDDSFYRRRMVRHLHACCARCGAGHVYLPESRQFALMIPRQFADLYAELVGVAVDPASDPMAWPWLRPASPMHIIRIRRAPIPSLDQDGPPHDGEIEVPADTDVAAIGEAILRSPWLPDLGPNGTWQCAAGPVIFLFGLMNGMPFIDRDKDKMLRSDAISHAHLRHLDRVPPERSGLR